MMMNRTGAIGMARRIVITAALTLAGCGTLSAPALAGDTDGLRIRVRAAPPAARDDAEAPPATEDGYLWVAGAWESFGGEPIWRRGHVVASNPGYRYIPASYEYDGRAWWFHMPHWKRAVSSPTTSARR